MGETEIVNDSEKMTTNDVAHTARQIVGAGVSATSATIAYLPQFEAFLRILASIVAIVSGLAVLYFAISDRRKKRKYQNNHEKNQ